MINDCTGCIIYERRCTNSFLIRLIAMLPWGITVFTELFCCGTKSLMMVLGINMIYICVEDKEGLLSAKIELR